jgi:hypothetical protein
MDGCFTAEQMVLAAYYCGRAILETEHIKGMISSIGKSSTLRHCYDSMSVICDNCSHGEKSVIVFPEIFHIFCWSCQESSVTVAQIRHRHFIPHLI